MTASEAEHKVQQLRANIDQFGLADSLELLSEITKGGDPQVLRPLLLMRPYREDDEHLDEMYTLIHTLEGFPENVYIPTLLAAAPELFRSSSYFLSFLLLRLVRSQELLRSLLKAVPRVPVETREIIRDILEKARADPNERPEARKNIDLVLNELDR